MEKVNELRDPKRIRRILAKVQKLWKMSQDSRFGQLLCGWLYKGDHIPFYEEDYVFEKRLDEALVAVPKCIASSLKRSKAEIEKMQENNRDWEKIMCEAEREWMEKEGCKHGKKG